MPEPDVIRGAVDDLGRPFVKIDLPGFSEPLTAFIDTGFNGAMIGDEYQAERFGFQIHRQQEVIATLASQQTERFLLSRGRINWLGAELYISAFVILESDEARVQRRRRKRHEEIVLGVELLLGCKLEIDFRARSLLIARLG